MAKKEPRTWGEASSQVPRQSAASGGIAATISRKVQGYPDQKRKITDSPTTMAKNRAALRKGK